MEVFTIDGVDYVRGGTDRIEQTSTGPVGLRLFSSVVTKVVLCPRHKGYRAIRKPRTNCKMCWEAYEQRNSKDS